TNVVAKLKCYSLVFRRKHREVGFRRRHSTRSCDCAASSRTHHPVTLKRFIAGNYAFPRILFGSHLISILSLTRICQNRIISYDLQLELSAYENVLRGCAVSRITFYDGLARHTCEIQADNAWCRLGGSDARGDCLCGSSHEVPYVQGQW